MRTRAKYIGRDDFGNEVYLVTRWHPLDPDNCESFLAYEWTY